MKKNLSLLIAFVLGITVTAIISWKSNHTEATVNKLRNPDSRPVIAIRKVKVKAGVSDQAFEQFAEKVAHSDYGKLPGVKEYFAKGERGDEVGTYLYVWEFDSKITRNFYFPVANDSSNAASSAEAKKFLQTLDPANEFSKMVEVMNTGQNSYTDYEV
ncbi:MAG: hypothetical protein ABJA79_07595, partial [Parafilimonas sp.]